jgi:hypothetical protein
MEGFGESQILRAGGLEGPGTLWVSSKNHHFLVPIAGFAGNGHQKIEILGGQAAPNSTIV